MNLINNGGYGNIYKVDEDTLLKIYFKNPEEDDFVLNEEFIKDLMKDKIKGFYLIKDLVYKDNKLIGYYMKNYQTRDKDHNVLTIDSSYLINNFDVLYNAILYVKSKNIEPVDFNERNIIIGNEDITIIDVDFYQKIYPNAVNLVCDSYLGSLFYTIICDDSKRLGIDIDYSKLNYVFRNKDDFKNTVYKVLSKYKYPIDYFRKGR